jgi:hypothetical protein
VFSPVSNKSESNLVNTETSNPGYQNTTVSIRMDTPSRGCPTCVYFTEIPGSRYGTCHRFPTAVTVAEDYWCGEWRSLHGAFDTK